MGSKLDGHVPGDPDPMDLFLGVEVMIADYGPFPLTEWEKDFMASVREQIEDNDRVTLTDKQAEVVSEIWEKMVSYSCASKD